MGKTEREHRKERQVELLNQIMREFERKQDWTSVNIVESIINDLNKIKGRINIVIKPETFE